MPLSTVSVDILSRLRHDTRAAHDALEQLPFNQALAAGTITPALTQQFLERLYGYVAPFEQALRARAAEFGPEWELDRRYRTAWLQQDLPHAATLPLVPHLPPLPTQAHWLGALYVLEGSTLGGQVIARQLALAQIPLRTYFSGRGEHTGPLWKSFVALLQQATTPATADAVVDSAVLTFQSMHAWLEPANS